MESRTMIRKPAVMVPSVSIAERITIPQCHAKSPLPEGLFFHLQNI
jgi:hypothetical protein